MLATGNELLAAYLRFDLMVEVLGLDRQRAAAWTLGRVLENVLWDVEDGATTVDPVLAAIARASRASSATPPVRCPRRRREASSG
jgi:streptomycin 6-kinase